MTLPLSSINLLRLREMLVYQFISLLKDMIEDTVEQADNEIPRARSRRVLRAGVSIPVELGDVTLLVCGCVHRPGCS